MSEAWAICGCGAIDTMTAGDARFTRPPGWTERNIDGRLVIRCPECSQ